MIYFFLFLFTFLLSLLLTPIARELAFKLKVLDYPKNPRKIHKLPTALLGGWAIFISFSAGIILYIHLYHPNYLIVPLRFYWAIASGGLILMIGGYLDDKYNLRPRYSVIAPVLATLTLIYSGIGVGINQISNP